MIARLALPGAVPFGWRRIRERVELPRSDRRVIVVLINHSFGVIPSGPLPIVGEVSFVVSPYVSRLIDTSHITWRKAEVPRIEELIRHKIT